MNKLITGFFMAWGNFLTLPCPYKHWDNKLKNMMLAFLPSVGAVAGILWVLLYYLITFLHIPGYMSAVVMVFFIFAVCGFIHLDGFMDCCDAIMSRRPLEDKLRILKDSTVGAFAVVMCIFLMLAWFGTMITFFDEGYVMWKVWALLVIPVVSRTGSSFWVMTYNTLSTSQYLEDSKQKGKGKYKFAAFVQMAVYIALSYLAGGNYKVLFVALAGFAGSYFACLCGRKQLGGISGDVAGFSSCTSEIVAMVTLTLIY